MPDDGGEPIELAAIEGFLRARVLEAAVATLRVYVHSFDIEDRDGRVVRAENDPNHPVVYPQIEAREPDGSHGDIAAFGWRFRAGHLHGPITLRHLESEAAA